MSDPKTTAAAYASSGGAIFFGTYTVNEIAAIVGGLCAVVTCALNWYYQRRQTKAIESGAPPRR